MYEDVTSLSNLNIRDIFYAKYYQENSFITALISEVGKVTVKSNADEA